MFEKLKNRIIVITMVITTAVLVLAGMFVMLFSSAMRPEPKLQIELDYNTSNPAYYGEQELRDYIRSDREEGNTRLLVTLFYVGAIIEVAVFLITYFASQKIVEPVKDAYEKQKLFIANASHELKTPLAIIQANMEAIEVDKENEKWKDNIEDEITHANNLVLNLLQLAKMDAGSISKSVPEKVNLNTEIKKRMEIFKPKFAGEISFKVAKGPATKMLPKQDILQVLDILLDNATKYGDKKVSINLNKDSVAIVNDGAVIPRDDLEKVFDRFYQTDKTVSGSGLGLAIAKAICEQNGWSLRCESNKRITTFTVVLPE